jgi:hypothetical protein
MQHSVRTLQTKATRNNKKSRQINFGHLPFVEYLMVAVATATKFRGVNTVFFSVEIFQVKIGHVWMTTSVLGL